MRYRMRAGGHGRSHQIEVVILLLIVGAPVEARVRVDRAIAVISAAIDGTVLEDTRSDGCRAGCGITLIVSDCRVPVILSRSLELRRRSACQCHVTYTHTQTHAARKHVVFTSSSSQPTYLLGYVKHLVGRRRCLRLLWALPCRSWSGSGSGRR